MINPPFWFAAAPAFIPTAVVQSIAVKQAFLMFSALFLCDLLLNVPVVPRLLGLPVPSSARFTPRVTAASILISLVVMIAYQVLETSLRSSTWTRPSNMPSMRSMRGWGS